MIYQISHKTIYDYSDPVSLCHNLVHLKPRNGALQHTLDFLLTVEPEPAVMSESVDFFGNLTTHFTLQEPHRKLVILSEHRTEVLTGSTPDPAGTIPWEEAAARIRMARDPAALDALQYTFDSPYVGRNEELATFARISFTPGRPLLEAVMDLTNRIHTEFEYDPHSTNLSTPLLEVLRTRKGVCQDFTQLEMGCLRSLGLATRYISGYLMTIPAPGKPRLVGADATHAWLSVYVPGYDWIGIDPTNDLIPADQHILVAWGRDYDDVSPIKGVIMGGGQHTVTVSVDVLPV
ncbi:transglutaminase family protein [Telmatocola sphagniphila]|uniref:Transglutaminase family protein n=1 Tax=Telmatocola sphagniphila TaxID=1123043 RepID=A0A8E6B4S8_9BACT|nr:transglutaminase family protein [Telmatocola sphagniphila]QVL31948.1 transglutaminase family protein [Telmatocola sphagniphila]